MNFKNINKYLIIGIITLFFLNYSSLIYNLQFKESKPHTDSGYVPISDLSFTETAGIIYGKSAFNMVFKSSIQFDGKDHFNIYFGEEEIFSTRNNTLDDIGEITNTTYKAAFYSLMFLRELLHSDEINNMTLSQIDHLNEIILKVISQSKKVPLMDVLVLNPHPVSERIEVLLLYAAYIKEKFGNINVLKDFYTHTNHLASLLENDSFFRYNSNHGLMQLRALLIYHTINGNLSAFEDVAGKIKEVYPIFVAIDGSILESSTGYQVFMYEQYEIMNRLIERHYSAERFLNEQFRKQQSYFNSIITRDGFLQGVGDAYSKYIDTLEFPIIDENRIFNYLNGVAGFNASSNEGDILSVLFVSMDNKPNAHKLPEDLSVYIYNNEPFFVNTGIYSYEHKDENRAFIVSRHSQNGVHFQEKSVVASKIEIENISPSHNVTFLGKVISEDSIYATRSLEIDIVNSKFLIQDLSEKDIESRFIIHPDITLKVIDDFNIEMIGKKERMIFNSINPILIRETWVSNSYMKKEEVEMLVIKSQENKIEIQNSRPFEIKIDNVINFENETSQRANLIDKLKSKYSLSLIDSRAISKSYIMFSLFIFLALILLRFVGQLWVTLIYSLFFVTLFLDLILSVSIIGLISDYIFLVLNFLRNII